MNTLVSPESQSHSSLSGGLSFGRKCSANRLGKGRRVSHAPCGPRVDCTPAGRPPDLCLDCLEAIGRSADRPMRRNILPLASTGWMVGKPEVTH